MNPPSLLLGIETSCDETAAAVVADGRFVLSSVVASQTDLHAPYGGVFPELASRQHVHDIGAVIRRAMAEAGAGWADLAAVAVTRGPGLPGSLLVGVNAAKGLALASGLPLVGVNHLHGHLYSNWLHEDGEVRRAQLECRTEAGVVPSLVLSSSNAAIPVAKPPDPPFPHLALIASGGHTDLVLVRGHGDYLVLGQTLDDAAGEAFDKAARLVGLGYPGGPEIERSASSGDPSAFAFPVAQTARPYDFSFSGLKTAVLRAVEGIKVRGETLPVPDLAAAFQAAVVRALVDRTRRAVLETGARAVLLSGGVSANTALREALRSALVDDGIPVVYPPLSLCTDNAAMIAAAGFWQLARGDVADLGLGVSPGLGL